LLSSNKKTFLEAKLRKEKKLEAFKVHSRPNVIPRGSHFELTSIFLYPCIACNKTKTQL